MSKFFKKNPKGFKLPDFVDSRKSSRAQPPAPSVSHGTALEGSNVGAWDYAVPKTTPVDKMLSLATKRGRLIEKTRWCPLCHFNCQERVDDQ